MAEQDTHCTRCGAKLQPTPSFTQMLWTCGCGGQTKPQMGRNRVPLRTILEGGPGTRFRIPSKGMGIFTFQSLDYDRDFLHLIYNLNNNIHYESYSLELLAGLELVLIE